MRLRIALTVDLDPEQVKILTRSAKSSGHGYDGVKSPRILIRRLLEGKVVDAVAYCREGVDLTEEDDDE